MNPSYSNENTIEKEITLRIRVPSDFCREDERDLDDAFSYLLEKNGYELLASREYKTVSDTLEFIFDDELVVEDEKLECIDGYLMATRSLVDRMIAQESQKHGFSEDVISSIEYMNFYVWYNVNDSSLELNGTYWYMSMGQEMQGDFKLPLSDGEKAQLLSCMEDYCHKTYHMSCHAFINEARTHEGLLPIDDPSAARATLAEKIDNAAIKAALSHADFFNVTHEPQR